MEVVVPDLGDFDDVEVIEVLVKPGDNVAKEAPLITLETDKASMDVPSPAAGEVQELKVSVGDRISAGDVILLLSDGAEPARDGAAGDAPAAGNADGENAAEEPPEDGAGKRPAAAAEMAPETGSQPEKSQPETEPVPVVVPDLGDFDAVDVIDVLVGEGDRVDAEQGLISLETEKATMDVPAPQAGTIVKLEVRVGDKVSAGDEIMTLRPAEPSRAAASAGTEDAKAENGDEAAAARHREAKSAARTAPTRPAPSAEPRRGAAARRIDEAGFSRAHASPSVRKLARELGVDLTRVKGSGRKGRITSEDLKAFVKEIMQGGGGTALPSVPEVDFAKFGDVELAPLTRIQRISGPRLQAAWINVPHVTQHDEADITELDEMRRSLKEQAAERGIRLTPLAFIVRACVLTLEEFPRFKASLAPDGENLVMKRYTHVGFAADTPNGLVVPVIRDADRMDIYEIAKQLGTLSERARAGKLSASELQGGVFTISSLGGIGGTFFTPIINAPEVAILGVSKNRWAPVYADGQFVPRLMLPLSLSYDHRVIDGAAAVRFTTRLVEMLGNVERLLEAIP